MEWSLLILVLPYVFLFLKISRNLSRISQFNSVNENTFFISVIVACRNESDNILKLLKAISLQDYSVDLFEVIVVDDNSTDSTFELAYGFTGMKNLRVVKNRGNGKKMAVAAGVDSAEGELILTTDADCSMGKRWISTVASFYSRHKPDMIICPVVLESSPGFFGKFQELEFLSLQGVTAGTAAGGKSTMCNGANLAFTKKVFPEHSENLHYEIRSGDDIFLLHSLKKDKGSKIMWLESHEASVTASSARTISSFLSQRSRWISKGKAYNDRSTVILAIVTFVTIFIQIVLLVLGFFRPGFLMVFAAFLTLKSIPDYLILQNTTGRYGKRNLMKWFLPSQLIYPFYVLGVVFNSFKYGLRWKHVS
jgi:cellulose synthase/poly-beta-1,6-N-acetylglucosamine synthase-like glycosyltransferase